MSNWKKIIPLPIKRLLAHASRMVRYTNYDSSAYWRKRAASPGQAAVLWQNQDYNRLYRLDQAAIVKRWADTLPQDATVLDIGCGIGVVAVMMSDLRADIEIDAVDFPEMIRVGEAQADRHNIHFIASSAEDYNSGDQRYDLVVSSGCYSAIRNIDSLKRAVINGAEMLKPGGVMLMIDPFHRWNYLARAKFGSADIENLLQPKGFKLLQKSGVLFWPYRLRLANSQLSGAELERQYRRGEAILRFFGSHFWADYKVLVFRKPA